LDSTSKTYYQPQGEIARGGMGVVLQAQDAKLGRAVAMKVMLRARATEEERWRFVQEARVLGQLAHPNIVPVHDLGADEQGRPFYTMKLVQGHTLQAILDQLKAGDASTLARYPLRQLLTIFQKACDAVAFAHSRGIIHRDLKPQNLMVGEFGEVLVMDWGLAKILPGSPAATTAGSAADWPAPAPQASQAAPTASEAAATQSTETETLAAGATPAAPEPKLAFNPLLGSSPAQPSPSQQLTLEGRVLGTPHYMSPEQAEGKINELDERTDVFALGGILYALLTLRPPVDGASVEEMLARARQADITPPSALNARSGSIHLHQRPTGGPVASRAVVPLPHLAGGRVPAALSAVAMKALATAPANRYPGVTALAADISAFQAGFATSAENANALTLFRRFIHRHKALAAAASLLVLLTAGFMLRLVASERKATEHARAAGESAKQALASSEEARQEADRANAAERLASVKGEQTRKALAEAKVALAEAAYREQDSLGMHNTLRAVPEDLRQQSWDYLFAKADSSAATFPTSDGMEIHCVAPHPKQAGVFGVVDARGRFRLVEAVRGRQWGGFPLGLGTNQTTGVFRIAFAPDGERLAAVRSGTTNAVLHRVSDGAVLLIIPSPKAYRADFSADGRRLLLHSAPGAASMVDTTNGRELWRDAESLHWACLADGRVFAASYRGTLHLVDADNGQRLVPSHSSRSGVSSLAASPTEKLVVLGFENGAVRGIQPDGFKVHFENRWPGWNSAFLSFTADGRWFVSLAKETVTGRLSLQLWEPRLGERLHYFLGAEGTPRNLCIHPLTDQLAVGGTISRVWSLPPARPIWRAANAALPLPQGVFWGSDDLFFTQTGTNSLQLLDLRTDRVVWEAPDTLVRSVTLSGDGRVALVSTPRFTGRYWLLTNAPSPRVMLSGEGKGGDLSSLRLNATGDRLAASRSGRLVVRNLLDGKEVTATYQDAAQIRNLCWVDGDARIVSVVTLGASGATGSADSLWFTDAQSLKTLRTFGSIGPTPALAPSPQGALLAEGGYSQVIAVRDGVRGVIQGIPFRAHDAVITALAWHPRLPLLASGSADHTVKVWHPSSGRLLAEFFGPGREPTALQFSPGGTRLVCAASDRSVHVWDIPPSALDETTLAAADAELQSRPPAPDPVTGWDDLISRLNPKLVKLTGSGWVLNHGVLNSPPNPEALILLPGDLSKTNYHLRFTVEAFKRNNSLQVLVTLADRHASFVLDKRIGTNVISGFDLGGGDVLLMGRPETLRARQITNAEPHTLEFLVHVTPPTGSIEVRLDGRSLATLREPLTTLHISTRIRALSAGQHGLVSFREGWSVTGAKVRYLKPGE